MLGGGARAALAEYQGPKSRRGGSGVDVGGGRLRRPGGVPLARRECSLFSWLSSPLVILSEAKHLVRWAEMLRCTQHDKSPPNYHIMAR